MFKGVLDFFESAGNMIVVMNHYSSIRDLSVVVHNNLLATRRNKATDDARIALLDSLESEMNARVDVACHPTSASKKKVLVAATKAVLSCSRYYFARKEIDDTLAPTFWVKE
jgi:hypothetical protein